MPLLVAAAYAGDLPWECPTVTTPEETLPYDDDAGVGAFVDDLEVMARPWEADCDWVVVAEDYSTTETCTSSAGAQVIVVESWGLTSSYARFTESSLTVTLPDGADTWTRLYVYRYESTYTEGINWGTSRTISASWTGSVDGAPDDGWAQWTSTEDSTNTYLASVDRIDTPQCDFGWGSSVADREYVVWRSMGGHGAAVTTESYDCPSVYATFDDVFYGAVDGATWVLDEVDLDGYSTALGDCDDTDPDVHPCAVDIPLDGIDQDCEGGDDQDADDDGHDADTVGGDDCDDADAAVYPGANDTAGDGADTDCDGHDDIDADGDGYTADGDNRTADCDDGDPTVHPGAEETPGDGIDQDCDGADRPADDPPEDTATADLPEPPSLPDPAHRCGGADALLLIPLARRRRRHTA